MEILSIAAEKFVGHFKFACLKNNLINTLYFYISVSYSFYPGYYFNPIK